MVRAGFRWKRPSEIFYGWWLVGITVFSLAVVIGPIFQGLGVFFVALERQFGWSRTLLSGAFSLTRAEGALMGPLEGYLTDRLGPRRMILIGFAILGIGLIGLSAIQGVPSFYLAFLVIFGGAGLGGWLPLMTAINRWFVRRRTTAMAIGMTGVNVGGLLVPALAWAVIVAGWRTTAFGLGILVLVVAVPIARAVRNRPEEYGLRADGDPPRVSPDTAYHEGMLPEDDGSFTVGEALKTRAFWVIAMAHGFSAVAVVTVSVHIIPAMTDIGMSAVMAGTVVATYTVTGVIFQLIGGFIGDRFPKPPVIAVFVAIQGTGMLVAAMVPTIPGAYLFALLFGIGFGGRVPLFTAIRGDYFGTRSFGTILGVSMLPMNFLSIPAPIAAGYLYDTQGSYALAFLALAVMNFVAAFMVLFIRKPSLPSTRREGEALESSL